MRSKFIGIFFITLALVVNVRVSALVKIKNLTSIRGAQDNQLIGYGLVVGLKGTGDNDISTIQAVANMLNNFGLTVDAGDLKLKNTAAVIVTATLPAFTKVGAKLDVTVSSYAGAKSLQGGVLLQTPLVGADKKVYAVAQGAVSIGGFNFGQGGRGSQKNHEQVGRVPGGGFVENMVPTYFTENGTVSLLLKDSDPQTAVNIAGKINATFDLPIAEVTDPAEVRIRVPGQFRGREVAMLALIGDLEVETSAKALIVINERTGTVVMGQDVVINTVAVSHGSLSLTVKAKTGGAGTVEPGQEQGGGGDSEEKKRVVLLDEGTTIAGIVKVLNSIGVTPKDMIAIFQAMRVSGALKADLILM